MTAQQTAKAAKAKERTNGITSIIVDRVDRVRIVKSMTNLKIDAGETTDLDELSTLLWSHFQRMTPREDMVTCWRCKGVSDVHLDMCPFCGAGDPPEEEKNQKGPENPASHKEEVTMSAEATETTKAKKDKKDNGTALAVPKDRPSSVANRKEKDLDAAVAEVQALKGDGAVAMWRLGAKIREIYDAQLWKLRTDEDEKAKYKSVEAFCAHELGMTPQNAWKLIDISRYFKETQVRAFGTGKLGLLLEAPPEDQKKLLEKLEKGKKEGKIPSKRQIEAEVRQINREKKVKSVARDGSARGGSPGKSKKKTGITIASILGSQSVKLYAKAPRNTDVAELKRAKKLGDLPWGRMELANDVEMFFAVQEAPSGELVLRIETRRVTD